MTKSKTAVAKRRVTRSSAEKVDAYQLVTDRIVAALEAGHVPWHRPWANVDDRPRSLSTGKTYKGINVFILTATAMAAGYDSPWWGTFKQIQERGGMVRKGEKGTPVVFWKFIEKKDPLTDEIKKIPFLRYFTVFNASQADDLVVPTSSPDPYAELKTASQIVSRYVDGPKVVHTGNRACYSPWFDRVMMPKSGQFEDVEAYYSTLFHELVHSTGHESRLARKSLVTPTPFGDPDYSREELVAEMGAAFLNAEAGIPPNYPQHVGYIAHWIEALKGDSKLLVQAAGAAQKAADRILGSAAREEA
jgi:antirestriction protein ArdC